MGTSGQIIGSYEEGIKEVSFALRREKNNRFYRLVPDLFIRVKILEYMAYF